MPKCTFHIKEVEDVQRWYACRVQIHSDIKLSIFYLRWVLFSYIFPGAREKPPSQLLYTSYRYEVKIPHSGHNAQRHSEHLFSSCSSIQKVFGQNECACTHVCAWMSYFHLSFHGDSFLTSTFNIILKTTFSKCFSSHKMCMHMHALST